MGKPSVFIGSSSEGLSIAREIELQLEPHAYVTIWKNGLFGLGEGTLEALVNSAGSFDFAVLVLSPDDMTESRGNKQQSPRDNVIFELGLFIGKLGRERTFIVYNRDTPIRLPSDLAGVTCATFGNRPDNNLASAVSPACTRMLTSIQKLQEFEGRSSARLTQAAHQVESVSKTAERLVTLLARSRAVELDVIANQFGALIEPTRLKSMQQDLADLLSSLRDSKPKDPP